jgi:two-component system cell cycle sensor histidine kinase/response regulator CckA
MGMRKTASPAPPPDFQSLFESAPGLYLVLSPELKIVAASDAYLYATMTKREAIVGRGVFDVFPDNPDDPSATGASKLHSSLKRVLKWRVADTMAIQKYDIRKPDAEGGGFEERYWSPRNWPVLDSEKNVVYIIHSVEDATENVRLKQQGIEAPALASELRAEDRFRKAFNANPEPITIATVYDGRYIDVNESFCRVTGYRREEVIGRTSAEMNFWSRAEDRAKLVERLTEHGSVRDMQAGFRTKSGEERIGLGSAELLDVAGQQLVIVIFKDVTDQKSLERQLLQSQKMEAIGQLSAGIAHDFNNLLSVIIGYSEVMEEQLAGNESLLKKCQQVKKAGERAATLTRQLLAFSRQQVLEPKIINLNAAVADSEKILRVLLGEGIEFNSTLEPALGSIKADQGQIEQVIMNLVVNARDAMPQGGKLTIETGNVELEEDYAHLHPPLQAGRYIVLTVCDTGIGMDANTQTRIFDPFFTTKEVGKGTGLGLSTVYGVVKQSGGHVWVYSEVGLGTTFKIYLPRVEEAPRPRKPKSDPAKSYRGTETILVVDDEEALRELTCGLLRESGYTVLEAKGPTQALQIAAEHSEPIHLLLTDVVMPGMNGQALAQKLACARPEAKIVYMSGYTGFTHIGTLDPDAVFMAKPITRETLLRKLHEVLSTEVVAKPN